MTDRELLELAAKAVGINVCWHEETIYGPTMEIMECEAGGPPWNPITDCGDALRLAVDLNIAFRNFGHIMTAVGSGGQFNEYADGDAYAATRRAIVRAAAEIGRAMK